MVKCGAVCPDDLSLVCALGSSHDEFYHRAVDGEMWVTTPAGTAVVTDKPHPHSHSALCHSQLNSNSHYCNCGFRPAPLRPIQEGNRDAETRIEFLVGRSASHAITIGRLRDALSSVRDELLRIQSHVSSSRNESAMSCIGLAVVTIDEAMGRKDA